MPIHIIDTGTQSITGDVIVQGLSSTQNLQQWRNTSGSTLMAITSAGNVGIGTTTPISVGTGSVLAISGTATTGSLLAVQGSAASSGSIFTAYTAGLVGLRVSEAGSIFAGPTVNFTGGSATMTLGGNTNTNIIQSGNGTAASTSTDIVLKGGSVDRTAGNLFQVRNNTIPVMTITALTSAGNVGIGTITPNEKLTVSGNISASGTITVSGSASFTGTTRPTSSANGTPAATSLITRDDGDARYGAIGLAGTSAISITSQITPQTIESASLAVGVYYIRMVFLLTGTVNTGTRHGYAFSGTATPRFFRSRASSTTFVQVTTTSFDQGLAETTTSAVIEGIISVTVAGTFSMQAAQNTSHPDVLSVAAASHMLITPCPNGSIA